MMNYEAVVIGTSMGGLEALRQLLAPLQRNFTLPIFIVQHRQATAEEYLTTFLNEHCVLAVKEAVSGEAIQAGTVYLAPADYHLLIEPNHTLSLSIDAKVNYCRPAIDVLFETAAEVYQTHLIGILLTGANHDGTAGLRKIKHHGGFTLVQQPSTAVAKIMPLTAIQAKVVDRVGTLAEIALFLNQLFPLKSS